MTTSSSDLCDQCGLGKFEIEQFGAETTKTCTNCGYYCENFGLEPPDRNDQGYSNSNSVSLSKKYKARIGSPPISQRRLAAITQLRAYLDNYPRNLCLHETAEALFLKSWEEVHVGTLAAWAAATVVTILREASQSVFIHEIADFFGVRVGAVSKTLLYIKSYYQVSVPPTSIEHFVTKYLRCLSGIGDADKVKDLSLSLCSLFEKIILGSSPKTTALLAIYNASIAIAGKVPAMTVTGFFRKTSLKTPTEGFERYARILINKLVILAKRLPWASKVNKRNYHTYICAIIKHQSLIFHTDVNGAISEELSDPSGNSEQAEPSECVKNLGAVDSNVLTEQMQLELPPICIKHILNPKPMIPEEPHPTPVSNSEILVEDDCPDSELKGYIRTDEEISIYLKLKALAKD